MRKRLGTWIWHHPLHVLCVGYVAWLALIHAAALAAPSFFAQDLLFAPGEFPFRKGLHKLVWAWGNFDGQHYLTIADIGHQSFEHSFFPLYPMLIRVLTLVAGLKHIVSALVISRVSFAMALVASYALLVIDGKKRVWPYFLVGILLFPASFYYAAVYNDSVFFLLATCTLIAARTGRFMLAGICAAAATLARLNGLALVFPIIIEYVMQETHIGNRLSDWSASAIRRSLRSVKMNRQAGMVAIAVTLVPAAFIGYLWYTHVTYGDWYLVFSDTSIWGRNKFVLPPQVIWRYAKIFVVSDPWTFIYGIAVLEFSSLVLYTGLLVWGVKKIRLSYWVYAVVSILLAMSTGTLQGMPRYGLHLYPLFLILAHIFAVRSRLLALYIIGSTVLLCILTGLFIQGYFVA